MARDDDYLADVFGATELVGPELAGCLADRIRDASLVIAACQAGQLRWVAQLCDEVSDQAAAVWLSGPRVSGMPSDEDVIRSAVVGEVQAVLGVAEGPASGLVDLGLRLRSVLPETLAALESGQLDLSRVRALAGATEVLDDELARVVQDLVRGVAGDAPWQGLSPRAWRARVERAVVRADAQGARRRRELARQQRQVWSLNTGLGMALLQLTADAGDVAMAMQVLTDLASGRSSTDAGGGYVSMDQRRADAFVDLFRRVRDGDGLPSVPVRRVREIGLVLHADTFFGAGPAARDPGEVRGLGQDSALDPDTAREQAQAAAQTSAVNVLLVDRVGALRRVVRVPRAPAGGWTRQLLDAAVRSRLGELPALSCESYVATVAIADHVRARNPRCTGYDCPRRAGSCDLDHDTPWPRGPTDVGNLGPRCRRQHEIKTRGLVRTRLHPDGSVDTLMLTGLVITTRPEPLPGHAPGEGHAHQTTDPA